MRFQGTTLSRVTGQGLCKYPSWLAFAGSNKAAAGRGVEGGDGGLPEQLQSGHLRPGVKPWLPGREDHLPGEPWLSRLNP